MTAESRTSRIIAIDDNESFCEVIQMLFSHDCEVKIAGSGERGLLLVESFRPDIIFCDLMMPGMGGLEFVHAMQAKDGFSKVPVIICSGSKLSEAERSALESEPNIFAFLPKPCPMKRLHAVAVSAIQTVINAN